MTQANTDDGAGQDPHNPFAPRWIVPNLIPLGSITLVAGKPGDCKSWVLEDLAIEADRSFSSSSGNGEFLGLPVEPCFVTLIDEDSPSDTVCHRLYLLNPGHTIDLRSMNGFSPMSANKRYQLKRYFADFPADMPKLLIIDCLQRVAPGVNLDSAAVASQLMGHLQEIRSSTPNLTIVGAHHTSSKKTRATDTSDPCSLILNSTHIVSGSDGILFVSKLPVDDETLFVIRPYPRRYKLAAEPISVRLVESADTGLVTLERVNETLEMPSHAELILFKLFHRLKAELTVKEIHEGSGLALSLVDIRQGLISLVDRGVLVQTIKPEDQKSHKVTYSRDQAYDPTATFYGRRLIAAPSNPRGEKKRNG